MEQEVDTRGLLSVRIHPVPLSARKMLSDGLNILYIKSTLGFVQLFQSAAGWLLTTNHHGEKKFSNSSWSSEVANRISTLIILRNGKSGGTIHMLCVLGRI